MISLTIWVVIPLTLRNKNKNKNKDLKVTVVQLPVRLQFMKIQNTSQPIDYQYNILITKTDKLDTREQ